MDGVTKLATDVREMVLHKMRISISLRFVGAGLGVYYPLAHRSKSRIFFRKTTILLWCVFFTSSYM